MVFNIRPGDSDIGRNTVGWIIGVAQDGNFPLNMKFDTAAQDSCALPNGNLMFSLTGAGLIKEVLRSGQVVRQWHVAGEWEVLFPYSQKMRPTKNCSINELKALIFAGTYRLRANKLKIEARGNS